MIYIFSIYPSIKSACVLSLLITLSALLAPMVVSAQAVLPATGQDHALIIGEDGKPAFGTSLSYTDNGDGTITDNNTGLIWEKKIKLDGVSDANNLHDADNRYPWLANCANTGEYCQRDSDCGAAGYCQVEDPQTGFPHGMTIFKWLDALNAKNEGKGFATYNDWRLPTIKELRQIVDYGRFEPAIAPAFHGARCSTECTDINNPACSCTLSDWYWTGGELELAKARRRVLNSVGFKLGDFRGETFPRDYLPGRAVRGKSNHAPAEYKFVDNKDGTITDAVTGLMWEKKIKGDVLREADNLNDADNRYPWWGRCANSGAMCGTDEDCSNATCQAGDAQTPFPDGMTIYEWVRELNSANGGNGFANYNDWRIPNQRELISIGVRAKTFFGSRCGAECIDISDPDCSCSAKSIYWSSTTAEFNPDAAWFIYPGAVSPSSLIMNKNEPLFVRAVRGSSRQAQGQQQDPAIKRY